MFSNFWRDTILGTIFVFLLMGLIGSLSFLKIFDVFDPIGEAFSDMELTDIVYSQLREDPVAEDSVVLVNIGNLSRAEIANLLFVVNGDKPKVVGIDSFFKSPKDSTGDALLEMAMAETENLVLVSKVMEYNEQTDQFDSLITSHPRFIQHADMAFANLVTGASEQDALKMCRSFTPVLKVKDSQQEAFAVKLVSVFNPEKAKRFLERSNEEEIINYRGNVMDYGASKFGMTYFALDHSDVLTGNFEPGLMTGKIVIFCFLGDYLGDRQTREDKFFTPLNEKYIGRSEPDMFGGVIHASIVSMILNEDYVHTMTTWQTWLAAFLLTALNVAFFSWIYHRYPAWYDIVKIMQALEIFFLIAVIIFVFDWFTFKVDLTYAMIAVALVGDSLEVYLGLITELFTKEGREKLFASKQIFS